MKLLFFSSNSLIVIPATDNTTACRAPSDGGGGVVGVVTEELDTVTGVDDCVGSIALVFVTTSVVMETIAVEFDPITVVGGG